MMFVDHEFAKAIIRDKMREAEEISRARKMK